MEKNETGTGEPNVKTIADLLKGSHAEALQQIIECITAAQEEFKSVQLAARATLKKCHEFAIVCNGNLDAFDAFCKSQGVNIEHGRYLKNRYPTMMKFALGTSEQDEDGNYVFSQYAENDQNVSRYSRIVAYAIHAKKMVEEEGGFVTWLSERKFEEILEEARSDVSFMESIGVIIAEPKKDEGVLLMAEQQLKTKFEKAVSEELEIKMDINAAGIKPGKHKAFIEVDNQGNVQFIGLSNVDEDAVKKEIEAEYRKQSQNRSVAKSLGWLTEVIKMLDYCVPTKTGQPQAYVRNSSVNGLQVNVYMKGKKQSPLGEIMGPYDKEFPEGSITMSMDNIRNYIMLLKTNAFSVKFGPKKIEFETRKDLVDENDDPIAQVSVQSVLFSLEQAAKKKHDDMQRMLIGNAEKKAEKEKRQLTKEEKTPKAFEGWKLPEGISVPSKSGHKLYIEYESLAPAGSDSILVPRYPRAVNSIWFDKDITRELKDSVIGNKNRNKKGISGKTAKIAVAPENFAIRYSQGQKIMKAFALGLNDQPLPVEMEKEYQMGVKDVKYLVRMLGRFNGKGSIVLGGSGIIVETEKGDYKYRQTIPALFSDVYEGDMAAPEARGA